MAAVHLLRSPLLLFLLTSLALAIPESDSLLKLKKSFVNANALDSWVLGSSPCSWTGIVCSEGNITGLRLGRLGLSGSIDIDALAEIQSIRTISFVNNSFSGSIPEFNRLGALKSMYLSGNQFSGEIPSDYFSTMASLKKLWLSGNAFTGAIPASLAQLPHLIELHLENNQFSGAIPEFVHTPLISLDMSNNKLEGEIPASLSKFGESSFARNEGLCGAQLAKKCAAKATITQVTEPPAGNPDSKQQESNKMTAAAIVLVSTVVLLGVTVFLVARRKDDELGRFIVLKKENLDLKDVNTLWTGRNRKGVDSNKRGSRYTKGSGTEDLILVNEEKGVFRLSDLMQATAEVLGSGGLGSAYKTVLSSGVVVVVKRMKEMKRAGRDAFDVEIRRLANLRHPNILTPLAYRYRKEEKLLVYEYAPKGSLFYLLHGDQGPYSAPLDWPTRLKIIKGVAQGLGYLHTKLVSIEIPHGNLKSSNVVLGSAYEPLLIDYGFCSMVLPNPAAKALFAYRSPESLQSRRVSPKCDVYCLGILILEILTGKFPSQYLGDGSGGTDVVKLAQSAISNRKEVKSLDPYITDSRKSLAQMEKLLHIGAACAESLPEKRPDMKEAIKRIEEIQVEDSDEATSA
ncbi:PREDICTED: pollen receptor-like kinase 3 [Nelumbo nucifera]|uniref:Pollen receptor-like kinase 3 n=2 Tax=Nelumbo nucifera TaxID=4432 RepID=A0A1U8Q740_NELNU|nr:PREDICTED: pollen receptor-like kinase 3 [Nelumbo nucifera]DAD44208.1 TPA_asm: hypothetical protein HUJ06_002438 [Nelumbo nucifera]